AIVAAVVIVLVGGCGVGFDDEPRAVQQESTTTTSPSTPSAGRVSAVLYYVREGALMPVQQELPDRSAFTVLSTLVQPPDAAATSIGLSTSIPAGTELLGTRRSNGRVMVDLSSAFDNVVGLSRQQAIGQMVMSATQASGVDTMAFEVDGQTVTVSSPLRGDRTEVDECDFASLLAAPQDAIAAGLPEDAVNQLIERRVELEERCDR
ncbi:MAG: GerMN domain-containing protein, partial [Microthrixaceae bacterium]